MVLSLPLVSYSLSLLVFRLRLIRLMRTAGLMVSWLAAVMALSVSWTSAFAALRVQTTTSLAVTSGGSAGTSVTSGSVVTLTAAVNRVAGGYAVTTGEVEFCDASAKSCTDIHLLGTAQLTSDGHCDPEVPTGVRNP
jgi:hypothetical protein